MIRHFKHVGGAVAEAEQMSRGIRSVLTASDGEVYKAHITGLTMEEYVSRHFQARLGWTETTEKKPESTGDIYELWAVEDNGSHGYGIYLTGYGPEESDPTCTLVKSGSYTECQDECDERSLC